MPINKSLKIYLVDDDSFCLSIYEQHLQNLGCSDITCFNDGTGCLDNLTLQPDVIFLDHGMDILNGIEVLKKIKRFNPDIYVVFLSGQENIETAVNSLKYGAFDYIMKGKNEMDRISAVLNKISEIKEILASSKPGFIKRVFFKA